jgi:RNA polymerase sigma-70 factor (ECF subfamily)
MSRSDARHDVKDVPDVARIEEHRSYLLRYALLQLRDASAAEDAVQETLLAALQTSSYEGRSALRTWLTGILKHKIVDHLRRQSREEPLERPDDEPQHDHADVAEALFADDGHWLNMPSEWGAPDRSFEASQFWKIFELCVQLMPARTARVFVMREILELTTEEICKELGVTATNCWVMLHRARLSLRECLETKWFKSV